MLDGKAVGVNTARKFIRYFNPETAQRLIDWDAIGKTNPLACDADAERGDELDGEAVGDGAEYSEDGIESAAEREYRRLNYNPNVGDVEELVDLEDKYRE
jgi:hypothetical protein